MLSVALLIFSVVIPIMKLNSERLKQKRASTPPRIYNHRLHGKEYNLIYTRRKGELEGKVSQTGSLRFNQLSAHSVVLDILNYSLN